MIPNVYLHDHICDSAVARLRRHVNLVDNFDHPEELDAIIVRQQYCPREVINRAKRCRLIQMHGVGLDRIDVEAAKENGISVKRTKGGNAQSVAELAIGFMLAMARKMKFLDRGLQAGKFQTFGLPETVGLELSGKKLGLLAAVRLPNSSRISRGQLFTARFLSTTHFSRQKLARTLASIKSRRLRSWLQVSILSVSMSR